MSSRFTWRIRLIWGVMAAVALCYVGRLYWLQVVDDAIYTAEANHQYASSGANVFNRGSIFFTAKDGTLIAAATLKTGYLLSINPTLIVSATSTYEKLNALLPLDRTDFLAKAGHPGDVYEEIQHRLDETSAAGIQALKLPGVVLSREQWRYYPGNTLASHVLGFVGYQGDQLVGQYGLERYYEDVLTRGDAAPYSNVFVQIFSATKQAVDRQTLQGNIVSTIEPNVQETLEQTLQAYQAQWNPDNIGAIIMDPKTGEIYALSSLPSFDPNSYASVKNPNVFGNPIVEGVYEMGSIIKPLTMSVGIDTGMVTATTTYYDPGTEIINGSRVSNFDFKSRGTVSMQEVLNQSLNTGAVFVEQKVGNRRFADYMLKFGIGEETGIDLPAETHGLISNLSAPRDLEYATASFGQGIALTPIETVRALAALGNGGYLVTPHLVKTVRYDVGLSRNVESQDRISVIKPSTSEAITSMLSTVYDKALLKGAVRMANYSVAAKTGTAQIANPAGGGYYTDRYLHSFFGYFPAYNPRFIIFMYALYPKGAQYASETLTHPFVDLAKFLINYYQIPPDR